jgi:hypothetical protein
MDMAMETPHGAVPDDLIGKAIGHYLVHRKLGEGGIAARRGSGSTIAA